MYYDLNKESLYQDQTSKNLTELEIIKQSTIYTELSKIT